MTQRLFRRCLLLASSVLLASLSAQTPPTPARPSVAPVDNEMVSSINLPDAPLETVLGLLERWTGRSVLRPQALPNVNYNLVRTRPISKADALLALETVMNMNGVAIIPLGEHFLKVVPLTNSRIEAPEIIEGSTLGLPPSGRVASKLFRLDFLRVNEFTPQLVQMLNPQFGGPLLLEKANSVLVTDSITTLQRIETLLVQLDQPIMSGLQPKFFSLRFAKASDVVNKLRTALQGVAQNQLGSSTTYSADDRTNQVILISDPRQHEFFADLITKLDVKADPNTRNEVIYLKHAAAKDVGTLLSQLISGQNRVAQASSSAAQRPGMPGAPGQPGPAQPALPQGQQPQPGQPQPPVQPSPAVEALSLLQGSLGERTTEFSSLLTVIPDERSNSVVISGTVDDIRLITELVEKIDILLAQVRIEVVIAEVTLSDNATSGISELGLTVSGDRLTGFSAALPGLTIGGAGGTDESPARGTITRPGEEGFISGRRDLAADLRLTTTPRKNNTSILSRPEIVTTHNKEGSIFVGEKRPVISGFINDSNTVAGGGRTTVSQQEIGISLKVKPLIGNDGSVQLEIEQDVSDVVSEILLDGNTQPIIGTRKTTSFISVKSGDIVVLGGLQRGKDSKTSSRLGPIPFIGDLFGRRTRENSRVELLFFLRPHVLTNTSSDNELAMQRLENLPQSDAVLRALDPTLPPAEESPPSAAEPRPGLQRRK